MILLKKCSCKPGVWNMDCKILCYNIPACCFPRRVKTARKWFSVFHFHGVARAFDGTAWNWIPQRPCWIPTPLDSQLAGGDEFRDGDWQLDSTWMCHWEAKHQCDADPFMFWSVEWCFHMFPFVFFQRLKFPICWVHPDISWLNQYVKSILCCRRYCPSCGAHNYSRRTDCFKPLGPTAFWAACDWRLSKALIFFKACDFGCNLNR